MSFIYRSVYLFLFGFAFLADSLLENRMEMNYSETPCLPKQWKKLTIKGIGPELKTFVIE